MRSNGSFISASAQITFCTLEDVLRPQIFSIGKTPLASQSAFQPPNHATSIARNQMQCCPSWLQLACGLARLGRCEVEGLVDDSVIRHRPHRPSERSAFWGRRRPGHMAIVGRLSCKYREARARVDHWRSREYPEK